MTNIKQLTNRIVIDEKICGGKPIIRGKRITVQSILEFLAAGDSSEDILMQYPSLEPEDINACLRFTANFMKNKYNIKKTYDR